MIFATVGTQIPFDRLIKAIDKVCANLSVNEQVIAQIGDSNYKAVNIKTVCHLDKEAFDLHIRNASCIIGHAGMGTIAIAMEYSKPLLVMPRLNKYGEVVHDHQIDIAKKFEKLGYLLVAYTEDQLSNKVKQLKTFVPRLRNAEPEKVAERITDFINSLNQ